MIDRTPFTKVVRVGTSRTYRGRGYSVFAEIKWSGKALSICGVEGPLNSGNCLGGCGQIGMHDWNIVNYAPGWSEELEAKFREVWDKWHLNDLTPSKDGKRWITRPVPSSVVDFLRRLPDTDRIPAWV